jgi:hypothetical protein
MVGELADLLNLMDNMTSKLRKVLDIVVAVTATAVVEG